jgi:hypothetical protein
LPSRRLCGKGWHTAHVRELAIEARSQLGRAIYLFLRAVSNVAPVKRSKRAMAWIRTRFKLLERKPIFWKHLDLQSLLFLWSTDTLVERTAAVLSRDLDAAGHMRVERAEVSIDPGPRERHGISVAGV